LVDGVRIKLAFQVPPKTKSPRFCRRLEKNKRWRVAPLHERTSVRNLGALPRLAWKNIGMGLSIIA